MSEWASSLGYSTADIFPDSDGGEEGLASPLEQLDSTIAARNAQVRKARQLVLPIDDKAGSSKRSNPNSWHLDTTLDELVSDGPASPSTQRAGKANDAPSISERWPRRLDEISDAQLELSPALSSRHPPFGVDDDKSVAYVTCGEHVKPLDAQRETIANGEPRPHPHTGESSSAVSEDSFRQKYRSTHATVSASSVFAPSGPIQQSGFAEAESHEATRQHDDAIEISSEALLAFRQQETSSGLDGKTTLLETNSKKDDNRRESLIDAPLPLRSPSHAHLVANSRHVASTGNAPHDAAAAVPALKQRQADFPVNKGKSARSAATSFKLRSETGNQLLNNFSVFKIRGQPSQPVEKNKSLSVPSEVIEISSDSEEDEISSTACWNGSRDTATWQRHFAASNEPAGSTSEQVLEQLLDENTDFYESLDREMAQQGRSDVSSSVHMESMVQDESTSYDTSSWAPTHYQPDPRPYQSQYWLPYYVDPHAYVLDTRSSVSALAPAQAYVAAPTHPIVPYAEYGQPSQHPQRPVQMMFSPGYPIPPMVPVSQGGHQQSWGAPKPPNHEFFDMPPPDAYPFQYPVPAPAPAPAPLQPYNQSHASQSQPNSSFHSPRKTRQEAQEAKQKADST
uniref:Uncharacterized protein n=1 Tax=Melanopsichium pennsylvanicum 4 TaxID=1398559 RepID=A0A077RBK6_9BASI|nr:uncharacterized protein BN887_00044 [Melanopsichium pennsylvanicum 4]